MSKIEMENSDKVIDEIMKLRQGVFKKTHRVPKYLYAHPETIQAMQTLFIKEGYLKYPTMLEKPPPPQMMGMLVKESLDMEAGVIVLTVERSPKMSNKEQLEKIFIEHPDFETLELVKYPEDAKAYAKVIYDAISKGEIPGVGPTDKLREAACGAFNFIRGLSDDGLLDSRELDTISADVLKELNEAIEGKEQG